MTFFSKKKKNFDYDFITISPSDSLLDSPSYRSESPLSLAQILFISKPEDHTSQINWPFPAAFTTRLTYFLTKFFVNYHIYIHLHPSPPLPLLSHGFARPATLKKYLENIRSRKILLILIVEDRPATSGVPVAIATRGSRRHHQMASPSARHIQISEIPYTSDEISG